MKDCEAFPFQVLGHKNGLQRIFFCWFFWDRNMDFQDLSFLFLTTRPMNAPLADSVRLVSNLTL